MYSLESWGKNSGRKRLPIASLFMDKTTISILHFNAFPYYLICLNIIIHGYDYT